MYACEISGNQQTDCKLNHCECTKLNDFELYNVNDESTEIDWSALRTKADYVKCNRKVWLTNKLQFNPTKGRCQIWHRQLKGRAEHVKILILII